MSASAQSDINIQISPFEKTLLISLDIDQLLALDSSLFSNPFKIVLKAYKSITADIFSSYNFLDNPENGLLYNKSAEKVLFVQILKFIMSKEINSSLDNLLSNIEKEINNLLKDGISAYEIYINFILLLYLYLQENAYGPSFTFIKETEKVDYKKDLEKFTNNYFNTLLSEENNYLLRENEIVKNLTISGVEPYKYSKFIIFYYITYYFIYQNKTTSIYNLFNEKFGYINTLWNIRLLYIQNKLIDEPIDKIQTEIIDLYSHLNIENKNFFNSDDELKNIQGYLLVEKSFIHIRYYNYKECMYNIEKAKEELKLDISLTGKFGRKTKYQVFDTGVLVVDVKSGQESENNKKNELSENAQDNNNKVSSSSSEKIEYQNKMTLPNENPLLEMPKLSNEEEEKFYSSQDICIKDQIYIVSLLNYLKKGLPDEDIQREIILTYSEKALKDSYDWLVYSKLLLHRSLSENKSTKKIERALLQIEALCNQYNDREPFPYNRLKYFFIVDYPLIHNLKKIYAEAFMNYGAVMTAFDIFKELKMWEDAIKCLYIASRRTDAKKLANDIIEAHPDPGIYCLLGELENKVEFFFKALETNPGYPRAFRCLGRYYYVNKNDEKAIEYYEKAMKINPIFPDIWFNLGVLYLRKSQFEKSSICFSKILSLDDSNCQVWGNLGVCFIQQKKFKESIKCFEEGFKKSRQDFKLLDNLCYACIECKDINKMIFALDQFFFINEGQKIKVGYYYFLVTFYIQNYFNFYEHDRDFLKEKIYKIFANFTEKDGLKPEVWDLYAFFIEEVEIKNKEKLNGSQLNVEEANNIYKSVVEIRLKELRTMMLNDWENDKKNRELIKLIVNKIIDILKKIQNDNDYIKEKSYNLNGILSTIHNKELKEQKELEKDKK